MTIVRMPQTDLCGLSEGWLFRHAGDRHWQRILTALGAAGVHSPELRDEATGQPLYPTFVAISARYGEPLAQVELDTRLTTRCRLGAFGRAFFASRVRVASARASFDFELLTAFVARDRAGQNGLHLAGPPPHVEYRAPALSVPPSLLLRSQALRHGGEAAHEIGGFRIPLPGSEVAVGEPHEPSPYTDFNAAGLLYFAAFPTLADTLERRLVTRLGLAPPGRDWALATSTVARDIFYQRNLDLGARLVARLLHHERRGDDLALHLRLCAEDGGATLAEVFTVKRWRANL